MDFKDFDLIVGLGNPGEKFSQTRHNTGFMFLDFLAEKNSLSWTNAKRFQAQLTQFNNTYLLKPQTFMNNSGLSVRLFCKKNGLKDYKRILVVHDELDINLREYKLSLSKSSRLHKGVASIEKELGTDQFWRLRIGTENRQPNQQISGEDYVLQKFSKEELEKIKKCFLGIINL